jgi:pSer/pThr/pTyr-binding forkhead associated (FHA) protein
MTWNMSWNTILGLGLNIAGSIILVMAAGGPISALVNLVRLLLKSRRKVTCGSPAELNNQSSQQEIPRPPGDVPGLRGRLILPDRSEILLRGELNRIGRDDFLNILPPKDLKLVSREHFVIVGGDIGDTLEDQSMNGTMINGRDISKQGWQELKDGDRICVAGILDLVYLARSFE